VQSRDSDVIALARAAADIEPIYDLDHRDNTVERCPFCHEKSTEQYDPETRSHWQPRIKHKLDCATLIAKDLLTRQKS